MTPLGSPGPKIGG